MITGQYTYRCDMPGCGGESVQEFPASFNKACALMNPHPPDGWTSIDDALICGAHEWCPATLMALYFPADSPEGN